MGPDDQVEWAQGLGEAVKQTISTWLEANGPGSVQEHEAQALTVLLAGTLLAEAAVIAQNMPGASRMTGDAFVALARKRFKQVAKAR